MKTKIISSLAVILAFILTSCKNECITGDRCDMEPNPGPCFAYMPRYYYDKEEKKCKEFIYGGCGGTVPFETLEDCQESCGCD